MAFNLNLVVMSLWDWLLAAWIYEEIFDNDSNDRSWDITCHHDQLRDYDYEDDFDDDFEYEYEEEDWDDEE